MTAPATTAAALLELMAMMAYRHPTSTSTSEASAVLGVCMRSSQRHLNRLRDIGLTESDGKCPAGWRLTPKAVGMMTMRRTA